MKFASHSFYITKPHWKSACLHPGLSSVEYQRLKAEKKNMKDDGCLGILWADDGCQRPFKQKAMIEILNEYFWHLFIAYLKSNGPRNFERLCRNTHATPTSLQMSHQKLIGAHRSFEFFLPIPSTNSPICCSRKGMVVEINRSVRLASGSIRNMVTRS